MIKLTKDIINKSTFIEFVDIEKKHIELSINIQKDFNKRIISYLKILANDTENELSTDIANINIDNIDNCSKTLKLIINNISNLNDLIIKLEEIVNKNLLNKKSDFKKLEIELEEYNIKYTSSFGDISANNNYIQYFINKFIKHTEDINNPQKELENIDNLKVLNISYPEKTLVISEIDGKVFLPYENKHINSVMCNNEFGMQVEQEVIDKFYTLPISNYKSSSLSRFKESYKLIREREKGSISQALELGIELFGNYKLHPAIITACKNLNELDVYLSCLEYDEVDDFKFFKIDFKSAPSTVKLKV